MNAEAYLNRVRRMNGVDRGVMHAMYEDCSRREGSFVLLGWSDYAKHLVNLLDDVRAIADDSLCGRGRSFRQIPVISTDEAVNLQPDTFVVTRPADRVRLLGRVSTHENYKNQPILLFPRQNSDEGRFYDPWEHSELYRDLQPAEASGPASMLEPAKIQFLLESMKQTLHLGGDVLEVGAWQGGSAWPLATLLSREDSTRRLVLLDFFEEMPTDNPEGIMCEDEIRDWFSFYPPTEIHAGNIDNNPEVMTGGTWSFIHYDAGFNPNRLARCFGRLQPGGVMVLDNYGHIAANPGKFDAFFSERGHRVSTTPHSEQGWVFKH